MKHFAFLLLVLSILLAGCQMAPARPPKPAAEPGHVVMWKNNAWYQMPQAEYDAMMAEKAKKAQEIKDKAAIVENATIDVLFGNPDNFLGKQAVMSAALKAEFKKFAGGKYRAQVVIGDKMLILVAYDADYSFTDKNLMKSKEKYGLDFMKMSKAQVDASPVMNINSFKGLVMSKGTSSTIDFKTKETKEYASITIHLVSMN